MKNVLRLSALLLTLGFSVLQAQAAHPPTGCTETRQVWKEGYWRVGPRGRVWIPGRWISQTIVVPCPQPTPPPPPACPPARPGGTYWSGQPDCHNNNYNSYVGMHPASFDQAIGTLRNASFESTRVEIAYQILNSNWVSAQQVRTMMQQFSFESSRLQVAKHAYSRCVDRQNYWMVNDAFTFSSSVNELSRYINGY